MLLVADRDDELAADVELFLKGERRARAAQISRWSEPFPRPTPQPRTTHRSSAAM